MARLILLDSGPLGLIVRAPSTAPLDLLDGIACMNDVCFCKRLVFKALREVA